MKVKVNEDEKIVIYMHNYFFKSTSSETITREVKDLFIKLIKYHNIKISGIYNVYIFENEKYGTILEIESKEQLLFNPDLIDIKVKLCKETNIYLKTNNYFILDKYQNIYYFDNYFYIDISNVLNLLDIIEFVDIIYDKDYEFLNNMLLIK